MEMKIEFEPEYLEQFRAYVRIKGTLTYTLYSLELLPRNVKNYAWERAIRGLKGLKQEMEIPTYAEFMLFGTHDVEKKERDELLTKIDLAINILEGKEEMNEEQCKELADFFLKLLEKIEKYSYLEEKVLGPYRVPTTYYP